MPAANAGRPVSKRLGLAVGAGLVLASVALIAAAPARRIPEAAPASQGRVLQVRLAQAPAPKLESAVSYDTLDVRPAAVDAPISPELASVQADAAVRAMQAADTRQAAAFEAEQRRENARMEAELRTPYTPGERDQGSQDDDVVVADDDGF